MRWPAKEVLQRGWNLISDAKTCFILFLTGEGGEARVVVVKLIKEESSRKAEMNTIYQEAMETGLTNEHVLCKGSSEDKGKKPRREEMRACCTDMQSALGIHFSCLLVCTCAAGARKQDRTFSLSLRAGLWMVMGFLHQQGQLLGMQPVQLHRPLAQVGASLGLMFCCHGLEILNDFSCELVFYK